MRALAHPLRLRLLGELRIEGPATATMLAERLEEGVSLISYHVRSLAEHGFVEEAPELARDGRERWRATHRRTSWSSVSSRRGSAAAARLEAQMVRSHAESSPRGRRRRWVADPDGRCDMRTVPVLTPKEMAARAELARIERYADREPSCHADSAAILHLFTAEAASMSVSSRRPPIWASVRTRFDER
jgi:DNA-binding transcriptional ArsR family regulator